VKGQTMDNRTWFDQRPSHKPIDKAVLVASEKYDIAQRVYDQEVEYCLDNGEWDQEYLNDLARVVDKAYKEMLQVKHQLNCPHKNISLTGMMHFSAGDVWDDIEEVCDDCGKVW